MGKARENETQKGMTVRQYKFAELILAGGTSPAECARLAGFKGQHLRHAASTTMLHPAVRQFLQEQRRELAKGTTLTKQAALARLAQTIASDDDGEATKAIAQASKMLGWDEPTEVVVLTQEQRRERLLGILQQPILPTNNTVSTTDAPITAIVAMNSP